MNPLDLLDLGNASDGSDFVLERGGHRDGQPRQGCQQGNNPGSLLKLLGQEDQRRDANE
jgi:hypothetical protein